MKKMIAVVFVVLLIVTGTASGQGGKSMFKLNGDDWKKWSRSEKLGWTAGFISGANVVCTRYDMLGVVVLDQHVSRDDIKKWNLDNFSFASITSHQLYEVMERFYKENKNQKVAVVDAIYVAKMEIEEKKPELIEAQKRFLRIQPVSRTYELKDIVEGNKKIDFGNVREVRESYFRRGIFVEPRTEKPENKKSPIMGDFYFLNLKYLSCLSKKVTKEGHCLWLFKNIVFKLLL